MVIFLVSNSNSKLLVLSLEREGVRHVSSIFFLCGFCTKFYIRGRWPYGTPLIWNCPFCRLVRINVPFPTWRVQLLRPIHHRLLCWSLHTIATAIAIIIFGLATGKHKPEVNKVTLEVLTTLTINRMQFLAISVAVGMPLMNISQYPDPGVFQSGC